MPSATPIKTVLRVIVAALWLTACAHAQEPPPPTLPPVTPPPVAQPPATPPVTPPATQQPPATLPAAEVVPAARAVAPRRTLTEAEMRNRRDAMFMMEGVLARAVELAAASTQREIEALQPGVRAMLFSPVKPAAFGTYLEDYGVVFQVQIPTYVPSVVGIVRDMVEAARVRPDPAQPAALTAPLGRAAMFDPDALYVDAVRRYLVDAMLKQSRSLDLAPEEWLTISARGEEGELGGPSIMVLRVKASDLNDFLAGRLTSDEVNRRVQVTGYSSRR